MALPAARFRCASARATSGSTGSRPPRGTSCTNRAYRWRLSRVSEKGQLRVCDTWHPRTACRAAWCGGGQLARGSQPAIPTPFHRASLCTRVRCALVRPLPCPTPPGPTSTGGLDKLADPTDATELFAHLRRSDVVYAHNEPSYAHLDLTWAWNAAEVIYPPLVELMTRYAGAAAGGNASVAAAAGTAAA